MGIVSCLPQYQSFGLPLSLLHLRASRAFLSPPRPFYPLGFILFDCVTPFTFLSVYVWWPFLFFHLFLFPLVILNLEFASLWTPALPWTPSIFSGSIPHFQHPLYGLMCIAIHRNICQNFWNSHSLLDRISVHRLVSLCLICLLSIAGESLYLTLAHSWFLVVNWVLTAFWEPIIFTSFDWQLQSDTDPAYWYPCS